jgi:hypothetical protein
MRYTRVSCLPFRATMDLDRLVQARDRDDALRQACLCLDRDLEELLSTVNAMNVTEVLVTVREVSPELQGARDEELWNPEPFDTEILVPRHIVLTDD